MIYFAPTIIRSAGVSSIQVSILATAEIGAVNVIMTIVSMWLIDRVGRRPLLLTGIAGMTISLGALGFIFHRSAASGELTNLAVVTLMIYVASFAISLGPIFLETLWASRPPCIGLNYSPDQGIHLGQEEQVEFDQPHRGCDVACRVKTQQHFARVFRSQPYGGSRELVVSRFHRAAEKQKSTSGANASFATATTPALTVTDPVFEGSRSPHPADIEITSLIPQPDGRSSQVIGAGTLHRGSGRARGNVKNASSLVPAILTVTRWEPLLIAPPREATHDADRC